MSCCTQGMPGGPPTQTYMQAKKRKCCVVSTAVSSEHGAVAVLTKFCQGPGPMPGMGPGGMGPGGMGPGGMGPGGMGPGGMGPGPSMGMPGGCPPGAPQYSQASQGFDEFDGPPDGNTNKIQAASNLFVAFQLSCLQGCGGAGMAQAGDNSSLLST